VSNEDVTLSGRVVAAVGPAPQFFLSRHEYRPPLDRDRMGNLLPQRREPYLDSVVHCDEACLLSLFAVEPADTPARDWLWVRDGTAWRHQIGRDETEIEVTPGELRVTGMVGSWKVLL
jgi:hypothetical protein